MSGNATINTLRNTGSSSGGVTVETPAEAANGSNVAFTFTATPLWIVADTNVYYANNGYTLSGFVATFTNPPTSFVRAVEAGSTSATPETPPETPDGIITTFTVSARPLWVVADSSTYFEGFGYSYAGGQIIFTNPPTNLVR